jgi:type II secretory pathway pseudopilin PulG
MRYKRNSQSGFTLIELFTAITTVGVLAGITIQSFSVYRKKAFYSVSTQTLYDARLAFGAAESDADSALPSIVSKIDMGGPTGGDDASVLPGLVLPQDVVVDLSHNPDCEDEGCDLIALTVAHCKAEEYSTWARSGVASELLVEKISGNGGC